MKKIADLHFLPGGYAPQVLGIPGEDALSADKKQRNAPVAVVTGGERIGPRDADGCPTGYPSIPEGEMWFHISPRASRDGVFDAAWLLEKIVLGDFRAPWNKSVAIATLNSAFKVFAVGNDGKVRREFLVRHTLPDGSPARWELWSDGRRYQLRRPKAQEVAKATS